MGRKTKFSRLWLARHTHMPFFLLLGFVVVMLFFNEDTSFQRNKEYDQQIYALEQKIQHNKDSAQMYREKKQALLSESEDIEREARENYNMQRSIEDVYIVE